VLEMNLVFKKKKIGVIVCCGVMECVVVFIFKAPESERM